MKTFAFALYENEAESEDELTFKKNDLFQVLQYDYMGMEGWWLCKLLTTNQTGLAAGNRLRKITDEKILSKLNESLAMNKTNIFSNMNKLNKCFSSSSSSTSSASSISGSSNSLASSISSPIDCNTKSQSSKMFNKTLNHDTFDSSCDSLITSQQDKEKKDQLKPKIALPPKQNHSSKMSINSFESNNQEEHLNTLKRSTTNSKQSKSDERQQDNQDEDDYDYDIPVNNQPVNIPSENLNQEESNQEVNKIDSTQVGELNDLPMRKSTSPTIDSGISTSSLMSLISENLQTTVQLSASSSTTDDTDLLNCSKFDSKRSSSSSASSPSTSSRISMDNSIKQQFEIKINELNRQISEIRDETCENGQRNRLNQLRYDLNEFIMKILKRIKEENACFHPNLNVFNKFKDFYRRFKEFYLFFENSLMKLELITIANESNDFIGKLSYLSDLLNSLIILANQNHVFDYDSQTSIDKLNLHQRNDTKLNGEERELNETNYEYEYQSPKHEIRCNDRDETSYENNEYSDYCVIDEEPEETVDRKVTSLAHTNNLKAPDLPIKDPCTTLKKSEEKIRKEIRLVSSTTNNLNTRINLCDQMLLKFYLKHIEDNLTELKSTYEFLVESLRRINTSESKESEILMTKLNDFGNKYAIVGHKLVFICDTLQRNLNNSSLKSTLSVSSNSIGDSLKMYMIRLKSTETFGNSQAKLLNSSLDEIYTLAVEFKQIISKYYYKSH
jgi:hypothetical protein